MAISPLPNTLKSLTFDGKTSASFGVAILGEGAFNAPHRAVEMINIPGRNGAFALDQGRFENITVTYPANLIAESTEDFAEGISAFRNFLCSRKGYVRLSDDYNPGEYRLAVYKSGLEVDESVLRAGEFKLSFDCKPQRFLVSGEEAVEIGVWGDTETESGSIVTIEADDTTAIKDLTADIEPIQDLHGYDAPWVGGAGKNKCPKASADESSIAGLTMSVATNGEITLNGTTTATNYIRGKFDTPLAEGSYTFASFNPVANSSLQLSLRDSSMNPAGGWHTLNAVNKTNSFTSDAGKTAYYWQMQINSGVSLSNFKFNPMLVVGSTAPTTFEPYENICPISGHTDVVVSRTGKNLLDESVLATLTGWTETSGTYTGNSSQWNSIQSFIVAPQNTQLTVSLDAYVDHASYRAGYLIIDYTDGTSGFAEIVGQSWKHYTLTSTAGKTISKIRLSNSNSLTTSIKNFQIELGSSATTFEPYQGDTYTIDLDGTRYGGTLDVTSGVLTVTHTIEDIGNLSWSYITSGAVPRFQAPLLTMGKGCADNTQIADIISDAYEASSWTNVALLSAYNGYIAENSNGGYITIQNTSYTDADIFKTAMTGRKIVYELATPTTVQLTAQEIDTLLGQNNIWASSGDVTVEYGQDPNILVNPTLFESSPLLEVEGYGEIDINGNLITSNNMGIGAISLLSSIEDSSSGGSAFTTYQIARTFDATVLNNGDALQLGDITGITQHVMMPTIKSLSGSITSTSGVTVSCSSDTLSKRITISSSDLSFVYGTSKTVTGTATISVTITYTNNTTATSTITLTLIVAYDGSEEITVSINHPAFGPYQSNHNMGIKFSELTGYSTKFPSSDAAYIDLDIGEAWTENSGVIVPLNDAVIIPANLPTLLPGSNTITFDNTITDLKIIPRWWKV